MTSLSLAYDAGEGMFRLRPTWVPRAATAPGLRLRLDKRDLYAFGAHRGGICERWIASTTKADNGKDTAVDEGLSYVAFEGQFTLLSDAFAEMGEKLIGTKAFQRERGWNVLCKLFDNAGMVPLHVHHDTAYAAKVGQLEKPESYFFPVQFNAFEREFPLTYFGLQPDVTPAQIKQCLATWDEGDNRITDLSVAYRLKPDSGWQVDPGVLHAPGSLVTYTIEKNSDVFSMFQNLVEDRLIPWELVVKNIPREERGDLDYIVGLVDWDANVDAAFVRRNRRDPIAIGDAKEIEAQGYAERWICHGRADYSAKEISILPGRSCVVSDPDAFGAIVIQGHGKIGALPVETPSLMRFGAMTLDELFVGHAAATGGVLYENTSQSEPLVVLKHFGPGNPESAKLVPTSR